ncbi:hypothetical protein ABZ468_07695 [Streptomyces sp. NPDC005708]|uniref:hypothetical protein n=1 Tax=Streptomyces sp. NPDC005708 TaxID=3154564 RepID=UPI00340449FE
MPRVTRSDSIRRHLVEGGLVNLWLGEATQKAGPDGHDVDGFSTRAEYDETRTLAVVVGAYGPNWIRTLAEVRGRLEQPFVRCTVIADVPGLGDHEVLVRWATSAELQERKRAAAERQAPLVAQLRAQERRQELEDAGQGGLF